MFVLDCSVTLAWFMPDEDDGYADRVLELLTTQQAIVPTIWHLEVMNVLLTAVRKGRIELDNVTAILTSLKRLNITTQVRSPRIDDSALLAFAHEHALTLYDAAYLHLALHEHLPLATLDRKMAATARQLGRFLES